ncbi:MAG: DUF2062 domain-containing protein [Salinivirgaceae bacterium]|jgi:uncharacterized protein (DUF2062 family)|nr:DUF2062 domain-containing protein [Salinivirgaceae bacterium]
MRKYYRLTRRKARRENLKKLFLDPTESPLNKAFAVFIGVFIGVLPIWGMQILSAIASAQYFKVNKPLAIVGSYINLTPLYPVLIYFSLKIGVIIMGSVEIIPTLSEISLVTAKTYFWLYAIGCMPVAAITAFIFGTITYLSALYLKLANKKLQPVPVKQSN